MYPIFYLILYAAYVSCILPCSIYSPCILYSTQLYILPVYPVFYLALYTSCVSCILPYSIYCQCIWYSTWLYLLAVYPVFYLALYTYCMCILYSTWFSTSCVQMLVQCDRSGCAVLNPFVVHNQKDSPTSPDPLL